MTDKYSDGVIIFINIVMALIIFMFSFGFGINIGHNAYLNHPYCYECNKVLDEGAKFCDMCGSSDVIVIKPEKESK